VGASPGPCKKDAIPEVFVNEAWTAIERAAAFSVDSAPSCAVAINGFMPVVVERRPRKTRHLVGREERSGCNLEAELREKDWTLGRADGAGSRSTPVLVRPVTSLAAKGLATHVPLSRE